MIRKILTTKERKFEKVYATHANDIYRICLHFLKDEQHAYDATVQTFFKCYGMCDETDCENMFGRLVYEAKQIISGVQNHEGREVRECTTSGEN